MQSCESSSHVSCRVNAITPSTYVCTSFIDDLVLTKSVDVGKTSRQTSLFDSLLY